MKPYIDDVYLHTTQNGKALSDHLPNSNINTSKIPIPPFSRSKLVRCFKTIE